MSIKMKQLILAVQFLHALGNICTLTTDCDETSNHNMTLNVRSGKTITEVYCEDDRVNLFCPADQVILIVDALYGRQDRCFCSHPAMGTTDCSAPDATPVITQRCERLASTCSFVLQNGMFKKDPCPGTYKYLRLSYVCADPEPGCDRNSTQTPEPESNTTFKATTVSTSPSGVTQTESFTEFRKRLKDQDVIEGDPVQFVVELTGPVAMVTWRKDDYQIKQTDRIQTSYSCAIYRLIITETRLDDTGVYSCALPGGEKTSGKLIVHRETKEKEKPDASTETTAEAARAEVFGSVGISMMILFGVFIISLDLMTIKAEFARLKRNLTCR